MITASPVMDTVLPTSTSAMSIACSRTEQNSAKNVPEVDIAGLIKVLHSASDKTEFTTAEPLTCKFDPTHASRVSDTD
jgi:hypothetical protein